MVWGSFLSWLGSDDARGPSLRQQKLDGASKMGTRPGSRLRARSGEASFQTRSRHGTCTWTAWPFSGPVSRVPAGQWPSESQRSLGTTHPSEGVAAKAESSTIRVTREQAPREQSPLSTPQQRVNADLDAVLRWAAAQDDVDAGRVAVMGFCFGGGKAIGYTTQVRRDAATVVFYGGG